MITTWWFKVGFWWFTRLENIKNKELIYDPKFVYSHKPMSHHKIRFHLILLPKFLKFFFRTNWFRFNRNYRAFHSAVTFSWTFWGPPKYGVLLYNFFPFRIFLNNFFKNIFIDQTPLLNRNSLKTSEIAYIHLENLISSKSLLLFLFIMRGGSGQ